MSTTPVVGNRTTGELKRVAARASHVARARKHALGVRECHAAATKAGIITTDGRDWWIANVAHGRWSGAVIGRVFGLSRQRVHQIVEEGRRKC